MCAFLNADGPSLSHHERRLTDNRFRAEWLPTAGDEAAREAAFAARHYAEALQFLERLAHALQAPAAQNASSHDPASAAGQPGAPWLFGTHAALADFAIAPFVRQFARQDPARFADKAPPPVAAWLDHLLARGDFDAVMARRAVWPWRSEPG